MKRQDMKRFVDDTIDQYLLMPPSLEDWLPERHLARFVGDLVKNLDLSEFYRSYQEKDGRGQAAYHPMMMVRLLLYGYCIGVCSSRQIEKGTYEDVAIRYLSGDQHPDHSVINEFRKRHREALAGLFIQALQLCQKAGMVKLGHVAIDGTKLQANASKHKAMSYGRMGEVEQRLRAEVEELLKRAEATDAAEDEKERQGYSDRLPEELARRESRLKKIQQAKAELEAEARQKAAQEKAAVEARIEARRQQEEQTGKKTRGPKLQVPDPEHAVPEDKAQRNFTDSDSRIMVGKDGFVQAYNAQIAVDAEAQIIVAADITQDANDKHQLRSMLGQVEQNIGAKPKASSADSGYWSSDPIADKQSEGIDLYVATPSDKTCRSTETLASGDPVNIDTPLKQMRQKLQSEMGRSIYKMRKAIVEPVFGQIKECRGFRRFSFRGVKNVRAEWKLVCLTHNILKLFRHHQRRLEAIAA